MLAQLGLQKAYSGQPAVTCQILKLAGDVVEAHVSYLQVPSALSLIRFTC